MIPKKVLEYVIIRRKQNLKNFNVLNPIDIKIENDQISNVLQKYKNVTYQFLTIGLLFSGEIKNNTDQTFVVCNGLSDARDLLINGKPDRIFGVINLGSVYNKEKVKEVSNWVNITFENSERPMKAEHFGLGLKAQDLQDILRFQLALFDSDTSKTKFVDGGKKNQY